MIDSSIKSVSNPDSSFKYRSMVDRLMHVSLLRRSGLLLVAGILLFQSVSGQNMAMYLTLLEEGKARSVREKIPDLMKQYPAEPGVYYLDAATTLDGEAAYEKFLTFVEKYPNSRYADDAVIKIGEYLYSRGLYTQASRALKRFAVNYPESEHVQRALNLMVRSYRATGELDSARYHVDEAVFAVPGIRTSHYDLPERKASGAGMVRISEKQAQKMMDSRGRSGGGKDRPEPQEKPWVVQVGAFGKYDNARRLVTQLKQVGYRVVMEEVNSGGRRLHTVRVVRYVTRAEAENVAQELKKRFGLDYRVLNSPEKK